VKNLIEPIETCRNLEKFGFLGMNQLQAASFGEIYRFLLCLEGKKVSGFSGVVIVQRGYTMKVSGFSGFVIVQRGYTMKRRTALYSKECTAVQ